MKCKHEEAYSRWTYEGETCISASGYCRDCGQTWELNKKTQKLEPTKLGQISKCLKKQQGQRRGRK